VSSINSTTAPYKLNYFVRPDKSHWDRSTVIANTERNRESFGGKPDHVFQEEAQGGEMLMVCEGYALRDNTYESRISMTCRIFAITERNRVLT
jgi:hypothetical protein